jgi:hypothetical protein
MKKCQFEIFSPKVKILKFSKKLAWNGEMNRYTSSRHTYAVSEVVGGLLIIVIAVSSFFVIRMYAYPELDLPDEIIDVKGYVTNEGKAVLEHVGGKSISSYKVELYDIDGILIDSSTFIDLKQPWTIGKCIYPLDGLNCPPLINTTDIIELSLYIRTEDNAEQEIFNGILRGNYFNINSDPILISSLKTNTIVEDIICFNKTLNPIIEPLSFIYNWTVDGNSIYNLLMPFDTNTTNIDDYSGNENHGVAIGPLWNNTGIISGCYYFDGIDDYITLPYCYQNSYIDELTVEMWIKTDEDNLAIASYDREEYWEICIKNGVILWSTTANGDTYDLNGVTVVNDSNWHHISVTYNRVSGSGCIYIDGILDVEENCHDPGESIGSGSSPSGYIGRSIGTPSEVTIFSSSFESIEEANKWFKDDDRTTAWWGYDFDLLSNDSINSRTGEYSIGGTGDFDPYHAAYNRESIDISQYDNVKVSVWYSYKSTESSDEIGLYYWDGSDWAEIFEELYPYIGNDNQLDWTYVEKDIPNSIDELILQFWWQTSSSREYTAIDDIIITGIPKSGGGNFSGNIDDFKIFNRELSDEQIYQDYLCSREGKSDRSIIVSQELEIGDSWQCYIIPNNTVQDDSPISSNILNIIGYVGG